CWLWERPTSKQRQYDSIASRLLEAAPFEGSTTPGSNHLLHSKMRYRPGWSRLCEAAKPCGAQLVSWRVMASIRSNPPTECAVRLRCWLGCFSRPGLRTSIGSKSTNQAQVCWGWSRDIAFPKGTLSAHPAVIHTTPSKTEIGVETLLNTKHAASLLG